MKYSERKRGIRASCLDAEWNVLLKPGAHFWAKPVQPHEEVD
jgi:hypothetical protein